MKEHHLEIINIAFGWKDPVVETVGAGLINSTWKLMVGGDQEFILQAVNRKVFVHPEDIDHNLQILAEHLQQNAPGYLFTAPVKDLNGQTMLVLDDTYYRVFNWIKDSQTINVVDNAEQARAAAHAFGKFTSLFTDFKTQSLRTTVPDFHNLSLRYRQFEEAVKNGNGQRINACMELIKYLQSQQGIVQRYENFIHHPDAKQRVTHHDTKISNLLFDKNDKALCVIDLDTVMPGYFISDVGDMFRTYSCPVSEEEQDLQKITVRKEYVTAIGDGYLSAIGHLLSNFEKGHLYFGGEVLIYMQCLRFATDYLENDKYYGSKYPSHNKVRADNQARLLTEFQRYV